MKKSITILSIIVLGLFAAIFVALFVRFSIYAKTPAGDGSVKKVVVVSYGQPFGDTLNELIESGLLKDRRLAEIFAKIKRFDKKIKAGQYIISSSMTPEKIFKILTEGKVSLWRLTIPEGFNIAQIAKLVSQTSLACSKEEFTSKSKDKEFAASLGVSADTLEGYLFPDTYFFSKRMSCSQIISAMTSRFFDIFSEDWKKRARELDFTMHEITTLASIIEKETGASKERKLISSVFHNRLKKNIQLASDPTVIYGIENFDGDLKKKHLATSTPYNTYKIKGLPPGPIASPGADSIDAALYPAKTDYYYFVAKKDSTHKFSKTMKEHDMAVRQYQLGK